MFSASCTSSRDFDHQLDGGAILFSTVGWEFEAISELIKQRVLSHDKRIDDGADIVTSYLALERRIQALKAEINAMDGQQFQSDLDGRCGGDGNQAADRTDSGERRYLQSWIRWHY